MLGIPDFHLVMAPLPLVLFTIIPAFLVYHIVANVYFHPLRNIPGPFWAKVSPLWIAKRYISGVHAQYIKKAHDQYGPVVRVAPNEVSFTSPNAWKDIYGHSANRQVFLKSPWYEAVKEEAPDLSLCTDEQLASKMRKMLSPGFSAQALSAQEGRIQTMINIFIQQIARQSSSSHVNICHWLNCATFDIIGDLALGRPFRQLETGDIHSWVRTTFDFSKVGSLYRVVVWFPPIKWISDRLLAYGFVPQSVLDARDKMFKYTIENVKRRLENPERQDFLVQMVADMREGGATTLRDLEAQARMLTIAGAESSATTLCATVNFLCRYPTVYEKLAEEIRSCFSKYEEIDGLSTSRLPYLKAVINESLRLFPPFPTGFPRVSPGASVDGVFLPQGTVTYVSQWAASRSPTNFSDPETFKPERWLDDDTSDKKEASQPFSLGHHACMGRSLALLELRSIITKFVWSFDFALADPSLDWEAGCSNYFLWDRSPLHLQLTRRKTVVVPPIDSPLDLPCISVA